MNLPRFSTVLALTSVVFAVCMGNSQASIVLNVPDNPTTLSSSFQNSASATSYNGFVWAEGWQYGGSTSDGFYVFTGNGVSSAVLRSDGFSFNFEGASFAALAPAPSGSLTIKGYKDGTEVGTVTLSSLTSGFQTYNAGNNQINGVDTLVFTGSDWRMSDFADAPVIPEPATMLAAALLLLPFGASSLRILRRKS